MVIRSRSSGTDGTLSLTFLRLAPNNGRQHAGHGVFGKGTLTRHHFIEHAAEREDVAPRVYLFPLGLLGRHVRGRSQNVAFLGM